MKVSCSVHVKASPDHRARWCWQLLDSERRVCASGEGYASRLDVERAVDRLGWGLGEQPGAVTR